MNLYDLEKAPIRLILWGLAGLYLVSDLALQGPLHDRFTGTDSLQKIGREQNWACTVGGEPITKAQLNLALDLHLARRGKLRADLPAKNLEIAQLAVLDEMISHELIRQWSRVFPITIDPEQLAKRVAEFESHFAPGELKAACQAQNLSQTELRRLLRLHAEQQYWLEEKISQATDVAAEEIRLWYEVYRENLKAPEVIRARHLFLSTVTEDTPQKEVLIRDLHAKLQAGTHGFEELAAAYSTDERTKEIGGDLGYFSRHRMPEDFTAAVFDLEVGQLSKVFRTKVGWHVVEVTERLETRQIELEEIRPEIEAFLENEWRTLALGSLLNEQLRTTRRAKVVMFPAAYELDEVK